MEVMTGTAVFRVNDWSAVGS